MKNKGDYPVLDKGRTGLGNIRGFLGGISGFMSALVGTKKKNTLSDSYQDQKQSEKRNQGVGDLEPPTKKYAVLGSLLGAALGLVVALPLGILGGVILLNGSIVAGAVCLISAVGLAFISTVGLLFGIDLWSLWDRFQ